MRLKRAVWCLLIFLLLSIPYSAAAATGNTMKYSAQITVSAEKTLSIAETLTFASPPPDGVFVYTIPAQIADQTDSIEHVLAQGCTCAIREIDGAVELTLNGVTDSVYLSYERIASADESADTDSLAVMLLPASELPIRSAIVSLVMPTRISDQNLSIELAPNVSFDYSVTAGVLSGSLLAALPPDTPVIADFTLPEGYFINGAAANTAQQQEQPPGQPSANGAARVLPYAVALLCGLGLIVFALSRGRGMQSTPDAWFDPAQAGYVLRGFSKNGDLVAFLPYWAGKGVIDMELLSDRRIRFTRIGCLPESAAPAQRQLFAALFDNGDELTLGSLPQGFRARANQARSDLAHTYEQEGTRVFTKVSYRAKNFLVLCLFLSLSALFYCALPMGGDYAFVSGIVMSAALCLASLFALIPLLDRLYSARAMAARRALCTAGLLIVFAAMSALVMAANWLHPQLTELAITSCAACILLMILYLLSRRRTPMGLQQFEMLKAILSDLRNPALDMRSADSALLYAYSIALDVPIASAEVPWGKDITRTLRDMQKIWNKLARANIIGWRFYQP